MSRTIRRRLLARGLLAFRRTLTLGCRVRREGLDTAEALARSGRPRIYAVWHSCALLGLELGGHERGRSALLASSRGNGPVFGHVARKLGHEAILGSSSRRGSSALRAAVRYLSHGRAIVVAADGPLGPVHRAKPGLIAMASLSGALIVPAHATARPGLRRSTWDQQTIPLPLGRICVRFGEPIAVPRPLTRGQREEWRARVEAAMNSNRDSCLAMSAQKRTR